MRRKIRAFVLGAQDGWESPMAFGMGRGWKDYNINEVYDRGVNVGQDVRMALHLLRLATRGEQHDLAG